MKLIAHHLTYKYNKGDAHEVTALDDINFVINAGELVGIIGHTGSGKSTLVQLLNGLLFPSEGTVYFDGADIFEKGYNRKMLRGKVGIVFQYPEHQLFAETVFEDVCFGPKNMGVARRERELAAFEALQTVGLEKEYFYQSPFDLSGGQKRRVAIAGVVAMKPEVLILDEPTAGLDPRGREDLMASIVKLQKEKNMTIIIVSHCMEDVAQYAEHVIVMNKGRKVFDDSPQRVFSHIAELEEMGLAVPEATYLIRDLKNAGFAIEENAITAEKAKELILKLI